MGQKVNPIILRISGGQRTWNTEWYAKNIESYSDGVIEDIVIFKYLERCPLANFIFGIKIEKKSDIPHIIIQTQRISNITSARNKKDKLLDVLQKELFILLNKKVSIAIVELKRAELSARKIALDISEKIEKESPLEESYFNTSTDYTIKMTSDDTENLKYIVALSLGGLFFFLFAMYRSFGKFLSTFAIL
jgi:hypothetical protein